MFAFQLDNDSRSVIQPTHTQQLISVFTPMSEKYVLRMCKKITNYFFFHLCRMSCVLNSKKIIHDNFFFEFNFFFCMLPIDVHFIGGRVFYIHMCVRSRQHKTQTFLVNRTAHQSKLIVVVAVAARRECIYARCV